MYVLKRTEENAANTSLVGQEVEVGVELVRFPDPPYGVGREKEPPRRWEKNFEAT